MGRTSRKTKKTHVLRKILFGILLILAACVLSFCVYVLNLPAWGDFDVEKILDANCSSIVFDDAGNEISVLCGTENRICVSIDEVPDIVEKAFIAAEDARFYEHEGIDIIRIGGAIIEDIKSGGYVQGASTITQQLIKLSHLTSEKKMSRKIDEAILAYTMEKYYDKDEILEMYLNYVYFGAGCYGIESAARRYFGISASELTLGQGATLAGILKSPSRFAPHINSDASKQRRNNILSLMCEYGYISENEKSLACSEELTLSTNSTSTKNVHGYYVDTALIEACEILDVEISELYVGGYRIFTAMDSEIQAECERVVNDDSMNCDTTVQSAIAVIDVSEGTLAAIVGGRDTESVMGYNRASEIRRQPGSVIKPLICYAPALEYFGYTAATIIDDAPKSYGNYTPKNYNNKYYGKVTLRKAISSSLNIPAVEVLNSIGVDIGMRFAKSIGIEFCEGDASLALALGGFTYGVSPLQMARAYSVFASGGLYPEGKCIERIENAYGEVLYTNSHVKREVMSEQNAFILTSMLQSVVDDGTGRKLGNIEIPLAGKTGTVGEAGKDGNRDAWFVAYNSEYSVAVWNGYDSAAQGAMPNSATGGNYPAKMLSALYSKIYSQKHAPDFAIPVGITCVELDTASLTNSDIPVLATEYTPKESKTTEYFVSGTEPMKESEFWQAPKPPQNIILSKVLGGVSIYFEVDDSTTYYRIFRIKNGITLLCAEVMPKNGHVQFTDSFVGQGSAEYFVVPVRYDVQLTDESECLVGERSKSVKIVLP